MTMTMNIRNHLCREIEITWGVSKARDTLGYTTCSCKDISGKVVARCNGGGYDLRGTAIGDWMTSAFQEELNALPAKSFDRARNGQGIELYGLRFLNPDHDPGQEVIGRLALDCRVEDEQAVGMTVDEAEKAGKSHGLERLQAKHVGSSLVPTKIHTVADMDGGCGFASVERVLRALGLCLRQTHDSSRKEIYQIHECKGD